MAKEKEDAKGAGPVWVCGVAMFYSVQGAWPKCVCVPKRNGARCGFDLFFLQNSCSITKKKAKKSFPSPQLTPHQFQRRTKSYRCVCVCVYKRKSCFSSFFFTFFCRFSFFFRKKWGRHSLLAHWQPSNEKKNNRRTRCAAMPPTHTHNR